MCVPVGQLSHPAELVSLTYFPKPQSSHETAAGPLNWPESQSVQPVVPLSLNFPAAHGTH
jgi:hypothetical protein